MQFKPMHVAVITACSICLTVGIGGQMPEAIAVLAGLAGWEEGGLLPILILFIASLAIAAGALHRRLHEAAKLKASPSLQGQAWLQRHLKDCTATLESIGHESATPHLVTRVTDHGH